MGAVTSPKPTPKPPPKPTPASGRGSRPPFVRWLRGLPSWAFAAAVLVLVALALVVLLVVNPGHRMGPVQPARPPVGGPGLPATRL